MLATLVATAQTRLALFSTEIEEQLVRLSTLTAFAVAALLFFGLGVVLVILFVLIAFWETHRLLATGVLALLMFAIAFAAGNAVVRQSRERPKLFSNSVAELDKDEKELRHD